MSSTTTSPPSGGTGPYVPLPLESFNRWLLRARPGQQLEYHRGHLIWDRSPASGLTEDERRVLARVADAALKAARDGLVYLAQRRNGPCDFSYLAIRADTAMVRAVAVQPLRLPQAAVHLLTDLPITLCLPGAEASEVGSERPLAGRHGATVAEADAALALLEAAVAEDQRKTRAIREALDIARAAGADPATRLAEALAEASVTAA